LKLKSNKKPKLKNCNNRPPNALNLKISTHPLIRLSLKRNRPAKDVLLICLKRSNRLRKKSVRSRDREKNWIDSIKYIRIGSKLLKMKLMGIRAKLMKNLRNVRLILS
jgi:hypothetical protein